MCGIFGWWRRDGAPALPEEAIRRATEPLRARGPDDFGSYRSEAGLALGFRRLSIIDLEGGHQPIANADGSVQVTLNGEIYNFLELREELEARGHRFATRADSEVIVHGYREWGEDVFEHLCGMFAIAIWDERERRLLLARDRLGIKPLYVAETPRLLAWASDPRAILAAGELPVDVDPEALALYLRWLYVPTPWSIYRGVHKLAPGEMRVVSAEESRSRRYWQLSMRPEPGDAGRRVGDFRELFRHVVAQHLIADVPLGAFLSGGMDSTAVLQAASEGRSEPILSFNVAFADPGADESAWARQAAGVLGTRHLELALASDPGDAVEAALTAFPEPFGDPASVPNYALSETIRRHCTVALSGDGGDEVFGGYSLRTAQVLSELGRLPEGLRRAAVGIPRLSGLLRLSLADPVAWYVHFHEKQDADAIARVLGREPARALASHEQRLRDDLAAAEVSGRLNPMLYLDLRCGLPDQMLTKVDSTSMAHGLEVRVPFLDHRVVEFAGRLPEGLKQSGLGSRRTKRLVRSYLAARFPEAFIHRPKQGFGIPITGDLRRRLDAQLAGGARGLDLPAAVDRDALAREMASPDFAAPRRWGLAALATWHEHVARPLASPR